MSKPVIAITRNLAQASPASDKSYAFYRESVEKAGGEALPVFFSEDLSRVDAVLDQAAGLLFSGGADLDPSLYGQTWHHMAQKIDPHRQAFELKLLEKAEQRSKPILGICLGCQLLNVHRGGSLIQFLPDLPRPAPLEHRNVNGGLRHEVVLEADSLLGQALGKPTLSVNTYHKQAIGRIGQRLRVTGRATDGVVEVVEDFSMPLFLGVQWHPERITDEPEHLAIFKLLVDRSRQ